MDLTLNLVWLLLGMLAIGLTLGVSTRRAGSKSWKLAGVVLVLAALFPFVSATDDILRVERFTTQNKEQHNEAGHERQGGPHSRGTKTDDTLIRLYEAIDAPLVPQASEAFFVLLFVAFVTVRTQGVSTRVAPKASGRSPPTGLAASL